MYAVIKTGGKQYRVQQGDVIFVEKLDVSGGRSGERLTRCCSSAMAKRPRSALPWSRARSVEGKVLAQVKGRKIVVYKYKAKKNERKKQGHRQPYTKVEITADQRLIPSGNDRHRFSDGRTAR